jgi:uncharacterized protein YjcR
LDPGPACPTIAHMSESPESVSVTEPAFEALLELPVDPASSLRRKARDLYWQGWRVVSIAEFLHVPRTTVQEWKKSERWDEAAPIQRVEGALESRLVQLIAKEVKSGGDFKEIDLLGRQIERLARVRHYEKTGKEKELNPNIERRNAGPKRAPTSDRNYFSDEQIEQIESAFRDSLFGYQNLWWRESQQRTRMILKSRQIGATWYFAREALIDAITTGRNQIFLSASKNQAHIFKQYIIGFAKDAAGVELAGDPIVLANGAHLYFLGTNARTAQGYHGNFYFDEFFWTHKFEELNKVASGMAMHKTWRKTYFSTPSSIQHEAFGLWSGDRFLKRKARNERVPFDLSHDRLVGGHQAEDRIWRNIITILDAERGGCNLFDLEELKVEYSEEEFSNLLMCEFVDDSMSLFPLSELQRCMVDSWEVWDDVKPFSQRPYGYLPVWVGYDPSHTGDSAGLVVLAPPLGESGPFRVLERHQFKGMDFEAQAEAIRKVTQRYNVAYIGIDVTGIGTGVHQLVSKFFPAARAITYSVESKTQLVLKARSVVGKARLQFDTGWVDLAHSFLAIKKTLTASGNAVTYSAGRNAETGHADLAWACMNALINEPLEGQTSSNQSFVELYD